MKPGDHQVFEDPDAEVESFRQALEARLEEEKILLEEEREGALKRIEELEQRSLAEAEEEWNRYEEALITSTGSFAEDLRGEITSLLDPVLEKVLTEEFVEIAVRAILPPAPRGLGGGRPFDKGHALFRALGSRRRQAPDHREAP